MQKNMVIILGAGVLVVLLIAGLWFFYSGDRGEEKPVAEKTEETRAIDFTARVDEAPEEDATLTVPEEDALVDPDLEEEPVEEFADEVLKDGFVDNLAEMIFDNYFPAGGPGDSSSFMLSFKMVNMHFATDLSDFKVDDQNILEARQEVMKHLFQPLVVDMLTRHYGPLLLDRIVYLAQHREKSIPTDQGLEERLLSRAETANMLMLLSTRVSYLARVFEKAAANARVMDQVEDYLQTVDELRDVYFEYWQLGDDLQDQEKEALGAKIKEFIERREAIRDKILTEVADTKMRQAGHDYVYEVQWIYRRTRVDGFSSEAVQSLADAAQTLSLMALNRAEAVLER
jgi:hypothetical protein